MRKNTNFNWRDKDGNQEIAAYVCGNRLLVKPVKAAREYIPDGVYEPPYEGAKDMLVVENVDSSEYLEGLFQAIYEELPKRKNSGKGLRNGRRKQIEKQENEAGKGSR